MRILNMFIKYVFNYMVLLVPIMNYESIVNSALFVSIISLTSVCNERGKRKTRSRRNGDASLPAGHHTEAFELRLSSPGNGHYADWLSAKICPALREFDICAATSATKRIRRFPDRTHRHVAEQKASSARMHVIDC